MDIKTEVESSNQQKNKISKLMSDVVVFSKYARYIPELNRRENWDETVARNSNFWLERYPNLSAEISFSFDMVKEKKVLPSMRMLQFGGDPVAKTNVRAYNCCYLPVIDNRSFSETCFLLMCGTGVGFSVQKRHTNNLLPIASSLDNTET